ncbi:putative protein [Arabidopsis thaliana]|uniref:Uncharacterized protein F7J8_60 n=1 Tax=Arabidopsis thaliana TaxID=3702 RepID=Q9LFC8_ARATH|nr:putative protein [Arabidopsis thaliana]
MLLCWYNYISRTLPFEAPREIFHKTKRVKKNGTMIPSPQSGDYRSFFNSSSPLPLIIELVHVQIIKFKDSSQIFKSLKKNGIITAFPWKSGYRSILNLFYPTASSLEFVSKSLYALFARAVYDHPLVEDFAKLVFMVESAIVSTDFSTIANFLKDYNFPVDPTPTTKASIKPGPIEHGTPLNPYIPKPPSPSSSPPPQQSQDGG